MGSSFTSYISFANSLHSYCWGDRCAIYHAESGDTHLLNKIDLKIIQNINERPASVKDLSLELEHLFEGRPDQYIQALLSNLAELGLIETVNHETAN